MRMLAGSSRASRSLQEKAALRGLIFKFLSALKFEHFSVWSKCDAAWGARVARMPHTRLKRELHFLLAHCSFRRIARLYNKFGARDDYFALFVGEYVENMGMKNIKILQPLIEHYISYKQDEKEVLSSDEEETQPRERMSDDSADEADDEAESTQGGPSTSTGVRFAEETEFLLCTSTSDEDISSEDNLSQTAVKDKDSPPAVLTSSEEDAPEASGNEANAPNGVDAGVSSANSAGEAGDAEPRGERDVSEAQSSTRGHQPPSPAYPHTPPPDDPAPVAEEEDSQPPPAPHPSVASSEEDDSESFYSSSDDESTTSRREISNILRNFSEPRSAILNVITNRIGDGDTAGGSAIGRFYTRRATPREREGHRIEDRNRLVYERFDERDITDRRVNEVVRRFENTGELPSTSNFLLTYMRRVRNVARAQELRWVYNMAEDEDSALHSHVEIEELLVRVRESFGGAAED